MSKKKMKRTNPKKVQKIIEGIETEKSNSLIFGGIILAITSIGFLIFVLSEKIFHLGWKLSLQSISNPLLFIKG